MKHMLFILLLCIITSMAAAQIAGTKHDFSGQAWNPGGEICEPCHTPHNSQPSPDAPLWNHDLTAAAFNVYTSPTMNGVPGDPKTGNSRLCLSCHDGTVALDSFGGTTGTNIIAGNALLGTNLEDDHPIAFTYDDALAAADGGLFTPSTTNSGLGGTIQADMLFTDKMECASCHDVHDNTNAPFLRKSNAVSALCLTCHNK